MSDSQYWPDQVGVSRDPVYDILLAQEQRIAALETAGAGGADAAAGIASRRTLGAGALQAAPGSTISAVRRKVGWFATTGGVPAASSLQVSYHYLVPWVLAEPIAYDQVSMILTTAGALSVGRALVYGPDATWNTGPLLTEISGFDLTGAVGARSVDSVGVLPAGLIWVGGSLVSGAVANVVGSFGVAPAAIVPVVHTNAQYAGGLAHIAAGAPPDPWPQAAIINSASAPRIYFRMT